MNRHRYAKEPGRDGVCATCSQGRSEDVHDLMVWRKSPVTGFWYSGPVDGWAYRIRTQSGAAGWWPEVTSLTEEDWSPLDIGVSLAKAKVECEEYRESPR
jgi:hypothetical protein